jgi:hypothetical protein
MAKCPYCSKEIDIKLVASGPRQSTLTPVSASIDNLNELMESVRAINKDSLNDFERKFVTDQLERYEQYGERMRLSEKQIKVLRKITGDEF